MTNELYRLNTNLIPIDLNFNESGSILEVGKCLFVMSNLKTDSTYSIESCLVRTPDSTEMPPFDSAQDDVSMSQKRHETVNNRPFRLVEMAAFLTITLCGGVQCVTMK